MPEQWGNRLAAGGRESHQALSLGEQYPPHRFGMEPDGRFQRQCVGVGAGQVKGADVGVEAFRDEVHHITQGLAETMRTRDDFGNVDQ